jgi:hypothetical protein
MQGKKFGMKLDALAHTNRNTFHLRTRRLCNVPGAHVKSAEFSLMPVPQLAQKQVGVVARIVDVVEDG